jgi:hypothetical protein
LETLNDREKIMKKLVATIVGVVVFQAVLVQAAVMAPASTNAVVTSPAVKAEVKAQTTCPVMGGAVSKKSLFVDKDGERIYVCCKVCVKKVTDDFATYKAKLEKEGVTLEKVPAPAPLPGAAAPAM